LLADVLRFGSALARLPATYSKLLPAIQCDASNVLDRKPDALLGRPEIPKVATTLPVKLVGKDQAIEQTSGSEKGVVSLGLHSIGHTVATSMDSMGIPNRFAGSVYGTVGTVWQTSTSRVHRR